MTSDVAGVLLNIAEHMAVADGVPVVFVDTIGINKGVTYIGTDNKAGAALAAKHICDNVPAGSDV